MPLPLGHAVIGLTINDLYSRNNSAFNRWVQAFFVVILANLPDMDVLAGLFFHGNGNIFHRGPTHSLIFAVIMGYIASNAWRIWAKIPEMSFNACFLLILSHILADLFFTRSPVSFLWPLEVNWSMGYMGWGEVMGSVFLKAFQDGGIAMGCGVLIILNRLMGTYSHVVSGFLKGRKTLSRETVSLVK